MWKRLSHNHRKLLSIYTVHSLLIWNNVVKNLKCSKWKSTEIDRYDDEKALNCNGKVLLCFLDECSQVLENILTQLIRCCWMIKKLLCSSDNHHSHIPFLIHQGFFSIFAMFSSYTFLVLFLCFFFVILKSDTKDFSLLLPPSSTSKLNCTEYNGEVAKKQDFLCFFWEFW